MTCEAKYDYYVEWKTNPSAAAAAAAAGGSVGEEQSCSWVSETDIAPEAIGLYGVKERYANWVLKEVNSFFYYLTMDVDPSNKEALAAVLKNVT